MANPSSFPIPNIDTFITLRAQAKNPDDRAAIAQFEHQLLTTFERMPDPSSSWITDILFLAFAAHDDEDLLGRVLNIYLSNISKTKILSFRMIEGLANLLGIASQFSLLDAAKISQIFEVLTQKRLI